MEKTLKACPCCGSKAELKQAHYLESEKPYSYVHCTNAECVLHNHTPHFSSENEQKNAEDAISAWNRGEQVPALH